MTFTDLKDNFIYLSKQHSIAIEITIEDSIAGFFEFKASFYGNENDRLNDTDFNAKVIGLGESVGLTKDSKPNRFVFIQKNVKAIVEPVIEPVVEQEYEEEYEE
jgi:hypothetical protein